MKHSVLVTGGTGFIGSHTTVELMNAGYEVVIVDNLSNSQLTVLDGIAKITGKKPRFEQFDLTDKQLTERFFDQNPDISSIIHFAAFKAVGESVAFPLKYYHNNLNCLINLMNNMIRKNIPYLVFSSSCTVYGQPDRLPVTEDSPVQPAASPYGNTKQISEQIIRDTIITNPGIKAISLRYFNPIGAHPSALIGELPSGIPGNLVPFITQTAIGIREQLRVFGNDYNTPDGTCIRDYINVCDLAKAHVAAIKRMTENKSQNPLEYFNLGTGSGTSVLEMIRTFEEAIGVKINYTIVDRRKGDIEKVWADTQLANRELNWKAGTSLADTLRSAWEWEKRLRS